MIKALLVDDEMYTREGVFTDVPWAELGIDFVEQAINGVDAFAKSQINLPDILITDVRMPQMNGIDLAYKVQECNPNCCIIFMSGYSDKEYLKSAIDLKAVNYIEKPLDMDELIGAIQKALVLHQTITKNQRVLSVSKPLVKNDFAIRITKRTHQSETLIEDLKAIYPNIHPGDACLSVIFQWVPQDPFQVIPEDFYNKLPLEDIKKYFFSQNIQTMVGQKDTTHVILHLFATHPSALELDFEAFYDWLTLDCQVAGRLGTSEHSLYLSISPLSANIFALHEAYNQAVIQLQRIFYSPLSAILLPRPSTALPYVLEDQSLKQFANFISNGQRDDAFYLIRTLSAKMRLHETTLDKTVRDVYFKFLLELVKSKDDAVKVNLEHPLEASEQTSLLSLWDTISRFNYLHQIETFVIAHIESYFEQFDEQVGCHLTCSEILRYIHNHYDDSELSLKNISDFTYLSEPYICVIFKKETGKTVISYIKEYRIEKACELLKNRQLKMNDIASQVGFGDANYFAKTFKKVKGLNPSDYRERYFHGRDEA